MAQRQNPDQPSSFDAALAAIQSFGTGPGLTTKIADIERGLEGLQRRDAGKLLHRLAVDDGLLPAALTIKDLSSQIDVVVHAVGILTALPHILEPREVVQSLSLGARNTGRAHDLVTDRQIAEFKFIRWRGGAEAIRQNGVFVDVFNLVNTETDKRRVLYVLDKQYPLRFLGNRRAISSVLSKSSSVAARFHAAHGDGFEHVCDYWRSVADVVEIIDLRDVVPALSDPTPRPLARSAARFYSPRPPGHPRQ